MLLSVHQASRRTRYAALILQRKCIFKIMTAFSLFITSHITLTSLPPSFISPFFPLFLPAIIPNLRIHSLPFLYWFCFQLNFLSFLFLLPFFVHKFHSLTIHSPRSYLPSLFSFVFTSFICFLLSVSLFFASLKCSLLTSPLLSLVCYFSLSNLFFFPLIPQVCFMYGTYF